MRGAVALLSAPKRVENVVLAAADTAVDELEIEAYEKSEADLAIWLATYPRVKSVLDKLNPTNGPAAEAIWKEMADELMDAIADLKPRPTMAAVTKVREIAEKMLDRVTNAALTSVASSRTA